jgi:REP element-mobilizing transposase RayT
LRASARDQIVTQAARLIRIPDAKPETYRSVTRVTLCQFWIYTLTNRGNAQADIYLDAADRLAFLDVLAEVAQRYGWLCHAHRLMDNHYYLLIETPHGALAAGMRRLNGRYTQRLNRRHRRVGHLLQGRYKGNLVARDAYLLELCR